MSRPLRVLLVDDNPNDRDLVLHQLKREFPGVEADHIFNSVGLDEAMKRREFDVVITDYQLCWTNGVTVTAAIKHRYPNCPVIMFTGTGSEEIAVQGMKSGLDDYIIKKPGHFNRLRAATRSVLERAKMAQRTAELEKRLESLLERFNLGVCRCDPKGELLEVNSTFTHLLQTPQWQATAGFNTPESFLQLKECVQLHHQVLKSGQPHEIELKFHDTDENPIWLKLSKTLTDGANGEHVIDTLLEDITKRKQTEEELRNRVCIVARLSLLSPREFEVMNCVAAGKTNKNIAQELGIAIKTIEMHRSKSMKKLRVRSVAQLVRLMVAADVNAAQN